MTIRKSHGGQACAEYAERLVDLSDGELPAGERAIVEAHVAQCEGCRAELRWLDASLAALRGGIVQRQTVLGRHSARSVRAMAVVAAGTAAAIVLAIGIPWYVKGPTSGWGGSTDPAVFRNVRPPSGISPPNTATTGRGYVVRLTAEHALRRIALLEQEARLETSLALMPDDPWFADQRAANPRLLTTYREAAAAVEAAPNSASSSKETL